MITCPNCQTPVDEGLLECPYCEQPLAEDEERKHGSGERVVTVNLKKGNPESSVAVDRLEFAIELHREKGTEILRLVHGYGSSGVGGVIRTVVRDRLRQLRQQGRIRGFVPGEDLRRSRHRGLPDWFQQEPSDVENAGITFVVL